MLMALMLENGIRFESILGEVVLHNEAGKFNYPLTLFTLRRTSASRNPQKILSILKK